MSRFTPIQEEQPIDADGMEVFLSPTGPAWSGRGDGLIGGDLIHLHKVDTGHFLGVFGKAWTQGTPGENGEWSDVTKEDGPFLLRLDARSGKATLDKTPLPIAGDVAGAASAGGMMHMLIVNEGSGYLVTCRVYDSSVSFFDPVPLSDIYPNAADGPVTWTSGLCMDGMYLYIVGKDGADALFLCKLHMVDQTFLLLSEHGWTRNPKEAYPLISRGVPLIASGPVSMVHVGPWWVLSRSYGLTTSFWRTKHPRRGWSLIPNVQEKTASTETVARLQPALTPNAASGAVNERTVPYTVSTETATTRPTVIKMLPIPFAR